MKLGGEICLALRMAGETNRRQGSREKAQLGESEREARMKVRYRTWLSDRGVGYTRECLVVL